jgi:hypothetical protein
MVRGLPDNHGVYGARRVWLALNRLTRTTLIGPRITVADGALLVLDKVRAVLDN